MKHAPRCSSPGPAAFAPAGCAAAARFAPIAPATATPPAATNSLRLMVGIDAVYRAVCRGRSAPASPAAPTLAPAAVAPALVAAPVPVLLALGSAADEHAVLGRRLGKQVRLARGEDLGQIGDRLLLRG